LYLLPIRFASKKLSICPSPRPAPPFSIHCHALFIRPPDIFIDLETLALIHQTTMMPFLPFRLLRLLVLLPLLPLLLFLLYLSLALAEARLWVSGG